MYVLTAILLIALQLFLHVVFSLLLFSCDLMTVFSVMFGFFFLFCVYISYRFLVCAYHEAFI